MYKEKQREESTDQKEDYDEEEFDAYHSKSGDNQQPLIPLKEDHYEEEFDAYHSKDDQQNSKNDQQSLIQVNQTGSNGDQEEYYEEEYEDDKMTNLNLEVVYVYLCIYLYGYMYMYTYVCMYVHICIHKIRSS
jgi:hypothetical protein